MSQIEPRDSNLIKIPGVKDNVIYREYCNPYFILNNLGYPVEIQPDTIQQEDLKNDRDRVEFKSIRLKNGEVADLWMKADIYDNIKNTVFKRIKAQIKIFHPEIGVIVFDNIDINNYGAKLIQLKVNTRMNISQQYKLICNIKHHKQKKMIHFCSTIVFKSKLDFAIQVNSPSPDPPNIEYF